MSHYIKRQKLKFNDIQEIELPVDCVFLSVSVFQGEPCLYVLINRDTCLSTMIYYVLMPLTEQLFCHDKDFIFQGSINIKNVTAHVFIKRITIKINTSVISSPVICATNEVSKKRGRPKKNADSK